MYLPGKQVISPLVGEPDDDDRTLSQAGAPPEDDATIEAPFSRSPPPSVGPPPRSAGAKLPSGPSLSGKNVVETRHTLTALHDDETTRARIFGRVTTVLSIGGLLAQIPYERDHRVRIAATIAYVALGVAALFVAYRARTPVTYTHAVFRFFAVVCVLAATVLVQYFGVFSAVSAVIVLGSSFFALGEDRTWGIGAAVAIAVAHGLSAALVTFSITPDLGIFPGGSAPVSARVVAGLLVVFLYAAQIWQARKNRRAMADALERSHREARLANARKAQLDEAKDNLDQALRAGQGGGRYTGAACGAFVLEEIVGRGAMGEVYAARNPLGARAAVKLLSAGTFADEDARRRFFREADIARRLTGPNLVAVHDVGVLDDGSPYIAMELLLGTDLAAILRKRATLPLEETAMLATEAARALTVAHREGVVHRDLKPSNLFRAERKTGANERPTWKILDFGVSKRAGSHGTLTEGMVVGTPGYMAPEQAQGKNCDAAADIFSLGAVLYRAVTGRRPFTGADVPQLLFQVVYTQPPRPRDVTVGVPRDVESVLAIALAKDPAARFSSAEELAAAFRAALRNELSSAERTHARDLLAEAPWASPDDDRRKTQRAK